MANRPIVITRRLTQTLSSAGQEAVSEQVQGEAKRSGDDDLAAAAQLMAFNAAIRELQRVDTGDDVLTTPSHAMAAALQSYVAQQSLLQPGKTIPLDAGGQEAKYDTHDLLGWIGSFFTWWRKLFPQHWLPVPTSPTMIPDQLRLGVIADWGTGLYGAPDCAKSLDADATGFDINLHLGDVYYSGTKHEESEEFLCFWPKKAKRFNLALNSNHEMYTGGDGLFNVTLPAFKQGSTCFWLQNKYFELVGLDTAYAEHDLANDQATWLQGIVDQAGERRVILFSHHQPFSQLDVQGPNLQTKLAGLLAKRKIFAWYWGHEHRMAVYDPHPAWGLIGRCIGHGGMPYFRDKEPGMGGDKPVLVRVAKIAGIPPARVLDGPNPYLGRDRSKYGPNGYMTLEFDNGRLIEKFFLPDATRLLEQELKPDGSVTVNQTI